MTTPLRALLVDDERLARKRLQKLLLAHPEIEVIGETNSVPATVAFAEKENPDVIFLDIQMPPESGFDVLPLLSRLPKIVFVTAHDEFAVRAFQVNALDYLLKPVHMDRLAETVRRLCSGAASKSTEHREAPCGRLQPHDLVTLRDKGVLRIVPACQIACIEAEGAYSRILLSGQEPMIVLRSIFEWESRLPSPPFSRLDRSILVNLDLVRAVDVLTRGETHLRLEGVPKHLILGRAASTRLRKIFVYGASGVGLGNCHSPERIAGWGR